MTERIISFGEYPIDKIITWKLFMKSSYSKISVYVEFQDTLKIDPKLTKKVFFEMEVDEIDFNTYIFMIGDYELHLKEKSMNNYTYKDLKKFKEMNHTTKIIGSPHGFSIFKYMNQLI